MARLDPKSSSEKGYDTWKRTRKIEHFLFFFSLKEDVVVFYTCSINPHFVQV